MSATLAGVELEGRGPVSWALTPGPQPTVGAVELSAERANRIYRSASAGGTVTLRIARPGKETIEVRGLYLLPPLPSSLPFTKVVRFADVRWTFPGKVIARRFNERRNTTQRHVVGDELVEPARLTIANLDYKAYSLNNGRPWTAREILVQVLQDLVGAGQFRIAARTIEGFVPEDVLAVGTGDVALQGVLARIPGLRITVDYDGLLRVYGGDLQARHNELMRKANARPRVVRGGGFARMIERGVTRPRLIRVHFYREVELRVNGFEARSSLADQAVEAQAADRAVEPEAVMLIQQPDQEITIRGERYGQNSLLPFVDVLAKWNEDRPSLAPALTLETLRRHYVTKFSRIRPLFIRGASGLANRQWARRWAAIERDYRTLWQIRPEWVDRFLTLHSYRVGVVSRELWARAISPVYCNYTYLPSLWGVAALANDRDAFTIENRNGYTAGPLSGAEPAPVNLQVVDSDSGVIRLLPRLDNAGYTEDLYLGSVQPGTGPTLDRGLANRSAGTRARLQLLLETTAFEPFSWSSIVTVSPASPNTTGRFTQIDVTPEEAGPLIGADLTPADGPVLDVLIDRGVMTAKYPWTTANGQTLLNGVVLGDPIPDSALGNEQAVKDVAVAQAAAVYRSFVDTIDGNPQGDPQRLQLDGNVASIVHTLGPSGAFTTQVTAADVLFPSSFLRFLPEGTRKDVLRAVQR